ncbi:MAG TPA: ABC transporter ATP-binding protein [Pyrinomonadaceae bacterium]|nr:ABC transporter ATP-binding protein [Pyrinomonadaceae bacterium]
MTEFLRIEDLVVRFGGRNGVNAVDGVSLSIGRGETLALVGESGCGKSTLARAVLRVQRIASGRILLDGEDITHLSERQMRPFRRRMQMVFQDPYTSLDPLVPVGNSILEPRRAFSLATETNELAELMSAVGLSTEFRGRKPSELSGGQRQRVGIARALSVEPELIVADEPVSSLDVSMQAQILNLLKRSARNRGIAFLFISHDLRAVRFIADRVAVMEKGKIVEAGPTSEILDNAQHPFTKRLIEAMPKVVSG